VKSIAALEKFSGDLLAVSMTPEQERREVNLQLLDAFITQLRRDFEGLRTEIAEFSVELKRVNEYFIQVRTENLSERMNKISEGEIPKLKDRISDLEIFKIKLVTALAVLFGVYTAILGIMGVWVKFK
jgi:hypothetical protein